MKKIKKILIFTFIAVLGLLSFALPLSVSAETKQNDLNYSTNSELKPMSIKIYFYELMTYNGPSVYQFDLTYLDDFYDYIIFNFQDYVYRDIYLYDYDVDETLFNFMSGYGYIARDKNYLKFQIEFNRSFMNNDDYILATNYNYIYSLPAHLLDEYTDGYQDGYGDGVYDGIDLGYDDGYVIGFGEGVDAGYDDGYEVGRNEFGQYFPPGSDPRFSGWAGYDTGYDLGFDDGLRNSTDYTFSGLISQIFVGLGSFLAIELLPNITFGAIFAVPLVFGIIFFIIGKRGGKDD